MPALSDFARQYLAPRDVSRDYAARLVKRAIALESFAAADLAGSLNEATLTAFLRSLHVQPRTVRCYRADLLTLWHAAADEELAPYPRARKVFSPRRTAQLVECYSLDEARRLLDSAAMLTGAYRNGVARWLYWTATLRVAWESGFRRGDVWRLRRDAVQADGAVQIVQHKTGQLAEARLSAATVAALDAIGRPQPCEWTMDASYFGRHFKRLREAAKVGRGTFKWLRRASGSYVEAAQPGAGYRHLGHAGPGVFARHYDARIGGAQRAAPPEL